jgi:hypothetical protein
MNYLELKKKYGCFDKFPKEYKTKEMAKEYMKAEKTLLELIPGKLIDYDLCKLSCEVYVKNYEYVPENFMNDEIIMIVAKESIYELNFIDIKFFNKDLCYKLIKLNPFSIQYLNGSLLDKEMCMLAVQTDPSCFINIPDKFIDEDLCFETLAELKYNRKTLEFKEKEEIEDYIRKGNPLCNIQDEEITETLCLLATELNYKQILFILERYSNSVFYTSAILGNLDTLNIIKLIKPFELLAHIKKELKIAKNLYEKTYE